MSELVQFALVALLSQSHAPPLGFDVASVKPTPVERQNQLRLDYCTKGGHFLVVAAPVSWSLRFAYRVKNYQVVGAPSWLDAFDSAYDIEGKPGSAVNDEQCRVMVRSLFTDRFKLRTHKETKESPVYFLMVAKTGTKFRSDGVVRINGSTGIVAGTPDGWTISQLVGYLSSYTDRAVVDRTGLAGKYGLDLDFSTEANDDRASIFTAVQQQVGLRLEPGRAPIEMLVIDRIERPDQN